MGGPWNARPVTPEPASDDDKTSSQSAAPPYAFDASHIPVAAAVLDRAFSVAERWNVAEAVRDELRTRGLSDADALARELARVPYWRLDVETQPRVSTARLPLLGPVDVTPAVVELWCAIEPLLTSPAARAVVADILWERRVQPAASYARVAADSHLERASGLPASLESSDSILRAWDLSRRIGDVARADQAESTALAVAAEALETDDYNPGVTLPLLTLLTAPPIQGQVRDGSFAETLNRLLERALDAYAFHDAGEVVGLMRRLADTPEEVARLELRHTTLLLNQALGTPDGLLKQSRLEEVIALARRYQQPEIVENATAALQSISVASLGLQRIETTHTLPIDIRESALDRYTRGRNWRDGLDAFLSTPPPTGRRSDLDRAARDYLNGGFIHTLFRRVALTAEGLPSHTTEGDDLARATAHVAGFSAAVNGELMATGLSRAGQRFGVPHVDEIARHLIARGASDQDLANALARAFQHYWRSDFDSALHVITPRIETAARSLLRELDVAIYRTQVGQSKGGYVGLLLLVEHLENLALDPDWAYYLRYVLLGPHGMNLRNDVAHGLLRRPSASTESS